MHFMSAFLGYFWFDVFLLFPFRHFSIRLSFFLSYPTMLPIHRICLAVLLFASLLILISALPQTNPNSFGNLDPNSMNNNAGPPSSANPTPTTSVANPADPGFIPQSTNMPQFAPTFTPSDFNAAPLLSSTAGYIPAAACTALSILFHTVLL